MCGRFTLSRSGRELADHFELGRVPELEARYNIAPTQDVSAVRAHENGERTLDALRWGLIPHWAKDAKMGSRMINARAEGAAERPAYRDALRERRCIVAADGFYEWASPRERGARRAHLFRVRGGQVFGIAGLWERWRDPDGETVLTCTLLTTEANASVRPLHDRMPVLLEPRDYGLWLDPGVRDPDRVLPLLVPCPPDWLHSTPVGPHVNDARFDDPVCVEPAPPEAPA